MSNLKKVENKIAALEGFRNEAFDIGFYKYFKELKDNKISQVLNSRERKINLETITYRQLNSWDSEGLLTIPRENREWRRFSIMDAIWVKIIHELREFGFPIEKIKKVKESLSVLSAKCKVPMPFLEFYSAFAIGNKMPVMLLVFRDGIAIPVIHLIYQIPTKLKLFPNHIHFS